jgi:hypothetical protein
MVDAPVATIDRYVDRHSLIVRITQLTRALRALAASCAQGTASLPMRIRWGWSPTGIRATSSSVS